MPIVSSFTNFVHREIPDDITVGQFAAKTGGTHITAKSSNIGLTAKATISSILLEVDLLPVQPLDPAQSHHQ